MRSKTNLDFLPESDSRLHSIMMMTDFNNGSPCESKLISIQNNEEPLSRTKVFVPPLKLSNPGSKTGLLTGREPIFQVERVELDMIAQQNNFVRQIARRRNHTTQVTTTAEDALRNRRRSFGEVEDFETLNTELKRFDKSLGQGTRPFKFPKAELEIYK